MIRYSLACANEHVFEHWFDNMADADAKLADGALTCPACGDTHIRKSLMAPNVANAAGAEPPSCAAGACPTCPAMMG